MTLEEARDRIGDKVIYRAPHVWRTDAGEEGVITSVNSAYVFVRYGESVAAVATPANCLVPVTR